MIRDSPLIPFESQITHHQSRVSMTNGSDDKGRGRRLYSLLAHYSSIIFLLPSALLVGYFIGHYLDSRFNTFPWLSMVFLFLGAAAGFIQVFRILNKKG